MGDRFARLQAFPFHRHFIKQGDAQADVAQVGRYAHQVNDRSRLRIRHGCLNRGQYLPPDGAVAQAVLLYQAQQGSIGQQNQTEGCP